jgi:hypothetical protein
MIVVRDVFQAKYGKGDALVALFKEGRESMPEMTGTRMLTDLSGSFFTVITEDEVESLAEWEAQVSSVFSNPEFGAWFERMEALVESGSRQFLNIV